MSPGERIARLRRFNADAQRWNDYEQRVQAYEALGMTRSDAQGTVDAEDMKRETAQ